MYIIVLKEIMKQSDYTICKSKIKIDLKLSIDNRDNGNRIQNLINRVLSHRLLNTTCSAVLLALVYNTDY